MYLVHKFGDFSCDACYFRSISLRRSLFTRKYSFNVKWKHRKCYTENLTVTLYDLQNKKEVTVNGYEFLDLLNKSEIAGVHNDTLLSCVFPLVHDLSDIQLGEHLKYSHFVPLKVDTNFSPISCSVVIHDDTSKDGIAIAVNAGVVYIGTYIRLLIEKKKIDNILDDSFDYSCINSPILIHNNECRLFVFDVVNNQCIGYHRFDMINKKAFVGSIAKRKFLRG